MIVPVAKYNFQHFSRQETQSPMDGKKIRAKSMLVYLQLVPSILTVYQTFGLHIFGFIWKGNTTCFHTGTFMTLYINFRK